MSTKATRTGKQEPLRGYPRTLTNWNPLSFAKVMRETPRLDFTPFLSVRCLSNIIFKQQEK